MIGLLCFVLTVLASPFKSQCGFRLIPAASRSELELMTEILETLFRGYYTREGSI
jgi:hypothetical protein